jgi:hypothetical protein
VVEHRKADRGLLQPDQISHRALNTFSTRHSETKSSRNSGLIPRLTDEWRNHFEAKQEFSGTVVGLLRHWLLVELCCCPSPALHKASTPPSLPATSNTLFNQHSNITNSIKMSNPRVFFDISIGGAPAGRVVMELFADQVPKVLTSATPPSGIFRHLHRTPS